MAIVSQQLFMPFVPFHLNVLCMKRNSTYGTIRRMHRVLPSYTHKPTFTVYTKKNYTGHTQTQSCIHSVLGGGGGGTTNRVYEAHRKT